MICATSASFGSTSCTYVTWKVQVRGPKETTTGLPFASELICLNDPALPRQPTCPARTPFCVHPGNGPWSSQAISCALFGTTMLPVLSTPTRTIGALTPSVGSVTVPSVGHGPAL